MGASPFLQEVGNTPTDLLPLPLKLHSHFVDLKRFFDHTLWFLSDEQQEVPQVEVAVKMLVHPTMTLTCKLPMSTFHTWTPPSTGRLYLQIMRFLGGGVQERGHRCMKT